jgi:hydroxymethylglutaryl-CoA reductase
MPEVIIAGGKMEPVVNEKKFYQMSLEERQAFIAAQTGLNAEELADMHALPLGIAQNFLVNGREVLVPMAIEEPSVVAGASFMARLARPAGGFFANTDAPEMIGQMQVINLVSPTAHG